MTQVDFYLIAGKDPRGRYLTACRLIEKAWRQGRRVYLRTESEAETKLLDDLLWTFRQGSFVPHEATPAAAAEAPVLIGHESAPADFDDVLVNLALEPAPDFTRFSRLAELVDDDEAVKAAARRRYKLYQEAGLSPQTHRL